MSNAAQVCGNAEAQVALAAWLGSWQSQSSEHLQSIQPGCKEDNMSDDDWFQVRI